MVASRTRALELSSFSHPPAVPSNYKRKRRHRPRQRRDRRKLLLNPCRSSYVPAYNRPKHLNSVASKELDRLQELRQYVALDCEMVGVGPGGQRSVLARVSLISGDGNCLLDTFVKVTEKVTDYRSWVSGVTPGDLIGFGAMDFGSCRKMVQDTLLNKILVGHGLENDLKALALAHPWQQIRDTALHEPFMRFDVHTGTLRSQKLRDLTKHYLRRSIQEEGSYHDSCVDARAALDL